MNVVLKTASILLHAAILSQYPNSCPLPYLHVSPLLQDSPIAPTTVGVVLVLDLEVSVRFRIYYLLNLDLDLLIDFIMYLHGNLICVITVVM